MNKSLIIAAIFATSLFCLPMITNAGISISFGTGDSRGYGYNSYGYSNKCYYPCYNRYGQAYACYPRSGVACNIRPTYYNSGPSFFIHDSYGSRWNKGYHRGGYNQRNHHYYRH